MKNINSKIAGLKNDIRSYKAELVKLAQHKPMLDGLLALADGIIQPDVCPKGMDSWNFEPVAEMDLYVATYWETPRIEVSATLKVDSFKHDERLLATFARAKAAGMEYKGHTENAQYGYVMFNYVIGDALKLNIRADLKKGSTQCRRVEVGRKIVEREEIQYELVCD